MNDPKDQLVQKLKDANNILVTVRANPTVDALAACIALTLLLNKLNKHASAVFSGKIPSTIEFLKPKDTIEPTTDSLRDFIVSLDKSKADKLRYKVEDEIVKIFITPYRSSISEKDLVFSQGDFNVDVVLALGVHQQQDIDQAIMEHGRILHDATVITVNNTPNVELGSINWLDAGASSLSEMATSVAVELDEKLIDEQIATALLTGVVAETEHFSNAKTTPHTMTVSAVLLSAGANQQLVASQINDQLGDANGKPSIPEGKGGVSLKDGKKDADDPKAAAEDSSAAVEGHSDISEASAEPEIAEVPTPLKDLLEQADAEMAAAEAEHSAVNQPLPTATLPTPVVTDDNAPLPPIAEPPKGTPPTLSDLQEATDESKTLSDIEEAVHSPHVSNEFSSNAPAPEGGVDDARKAVEDALKATPSEPVLEPLEALNAQPVNLNLSHEAVDEPTASPAADPGQNQFAGDPGSGQPPFGAPNEQNLPPLPPEPQQPYIPPAPGIMSVPTVQPLTPAGPAPVDNNFHLSVSPGAAVDFSSPMFDPNPQAPAPGQLPPNPAINEPAPLAMSPSDQPFTFPMPNAGGMQIPAAQTMPPTSTGLPPQGPPPPPVPPPMGPPNFGMPQ